MPFVGALAAAFGRLIVSRVGQWVVAAMVFLGLQFTANEFVVSPLLDYVKSLVGNAPQVIIDWLGFLNVDRYVTMILSAYAVAASMSAIKLRKKPTGGA